MKRKRFKTPLQVATEVLRGGMRHSDALCAVNGPLDFKVNSRTKIEYRTDNCLGEIMGNARRVGQVGFRYDFVFTAATDAAGLLHPNARLFYQFVDGPYRMPSPQLLQHAEEPEGLTLAQQLGNSHPLDSEITGITYDIATLAGHQAFMAELRVRLQIQGKILRRVGLDKKGEKVINGVTNPETLQRIKHLVKERMKSYGQNKNGPTQS